MCYGEIFQEQANLFSGARGYLRVNDLAYHSDKCNKWFIPC